MVQPDLGIEILIRSGRADRLLLGDPWEASFAEAEELPQLRAAVDALRPGERMLLDRPARTGARRAAGGPVARRRSPRPARCSRRCRSGRSSGSTGASGSGPSPGAPGTSRSWSWSRRR